MGNIETVYELRNNFKQMLLSPSEILSTGFPYMDIASDLVSNEIDAEVIAEKFFNYYNNQNIALRSATISVINTEYLEKLAFLMRDIYRQYANQYNQKEGLLFSTESVAQYDRTYSNYFFDFKQFLTCFRENNSYCDILSLLSVIQPYYKHTDKMFSVLDLDGTAGLSIYIPDNYEQRKNLHTYYATLDWVKDSNAAVLFE
jgi:hypothetical protein